MSVFRSTRVFAWWHIMPVYSIPAISLYFQTLAPVSSVGCKSLDLIKLVKELRNTCL